MSKRNKYLTIEEKRQLALEGKHVPLCAYPDEKEEKRIKKERKKLFKSFKRNLNL